MLLSNRIGGLVRRDLATAVASTSAARNEWIAFGIAAVALLLIIAGLAVVALRRRSKRTILPPMRQRSDDQP